jgi:hypothetical protein
MSLDNLANLWLGTFIEAPSPQAMLISTMVVMPPVETPTLSHGEVDYEELRQRVARKKTQGQSDPVVQLVEFPWGRGFRSLSRRSHTQDPTAEDMASIEYQVKATATPSTICVFGQVPATARERAEQLIDDMAGMVGTLTVRLPSSG